MKNRLISIFLFCAFICSFVGTASVMAAEENKITISADKQYVQKGEEVTYTLSGVLNGIKGVQIKMAYDAEIASYAENSMNFAVGAFTDYYGGSENDGEITMAFAMEEGTDYTGNIASFGMKAINNGGIGLKVESVLAKDNMGNTIHVDVEANNVEVVSKNNVEFTAVPNVSSVNTGEEVLYDISISDVNVKCMQYSVEYDDAHFVLEEALAAPEYIGGEKNIVIKQEDGRVNCVYYAENENTLSGKLMTLKFKVKSIDETIGYIEPIKISGFKAAGSENDFSCSTVCKPISVEKTDKISMEFIADKLTAGENELVSYNINMSGMARYKGMQATLHYDASKLELVGVSSPDYEGSGFVSYNTSSAGLIKMIFAAVNDNRLPDGYIGTAVFRVKKQTKSSYADMRVGTVKASVDGESMADADYYKYADEVFVYQGQKITFTGTPNTNIAVSGENVTYTFKVSDLNNFKGGSFVLNYDSDALEFVSLENEAFSTASFRTIKETEPGVIKGMIVYRNVYTGSGGEFRATFKVKSVGSFINPDIYFSDFVSDDYMTFNILPVDVYPVDPALETINAISAIGEVTLASKPLIDYAYALYNMLEPEFQARVVNIDKLFEAEARYWELYNAQPVYSCAVSGSNITLTQNKPCDKVLKMYVAQYNDRGEMVNVKSYPINGSAVYTIDRYTDNIRCYIWDENMTVYESVGYSYE